MPVRSYPFIVDNTRIREETMAAEETRLQERRFSNIRRAKKLLRWLPRRANLHRYPFLRRFASTARKRSYLWSFRTKHVMPAFFAGCILSFMPLFGVQIPLAFVASLILRANLPILVGLQLISNPLTLPVIYHAAYMIGDFSFGIFGDPNQMTLLTGIEENAGLLGQGVYKITAAMVGGIVIGLCFGLVLSVTYKIAAIGASRTLIRMREVRESGSGTTPERDSAIREELDSIPS